MSKAEPQNADSLRIARALVAEDAPRSGKRTPERMAAALQYTCDRVSERLRDSMGDDGRNALLARALARAQLDHPALTTIRRLDKDIIHLDGVAASVEAYGLAPVTAAIEALLAALLDVLTRLIGEEMALRLINHQAASPAGAEVESP